MDLSSYVDALHRELVVAAEAGGDQARVLAERLVAPLESGVRLQLLEALSAAADEITREMAPGSVDVRLRGGDPEFVVTAPPADRAFGEGPEGPAGPAEPGLGVPPPPPPSSEAPEGDESTSRITLRLPGHLKPRIDEAANRAGLSANAWLVRVVSAALQPEDRAGTAERRSSLPFGGRHTGWVR